MKPFQPGAEKAWIIMMTPPTMNSQPRKVLATMPDSSGNAIAARPAIMRRMPAARNHPHFSVINFFVSKSRASMSAAVSGAMFDIPYFRAASRLFRAARDFRNIAESCDELRSTGPYGGASADTRSKIGRRRCGTAKREIRANNGTRIRG